METIKDYYRLTKPGIVYGNLLHAIVGYGLAYDYGLSLWSATGLVVGMGAVIASSCVANNLLDRGIDAKMVRTQQRSLVTGRIQTPAATLFALILLAVGVAVLASTTNLMTLQLALIGYIWYVFLYGMAKRRTRHSTLIGSVPGAIPIMAGYTAASGTGDTVAWLLFLMLVTWQMPHFYAIALYRQKEYDAAGLPVASVVLGRKVVYQQMIVFAALYCCVIAVLIAMGGVHWIGGAVLLIGGLYWTQQIAIGRPAFTDAWARRTFRQSLLLTLALAFATAVTVVLS